MKNERTSQGRRAWLKAALSGALAWTISSPGAPMEGPEPRRVRRGDMFYRRLGRTGLLVSEISLGGSPLPDHDLLRAAIDRGVNYIDTSHNYGNGNSERQIGRLFKEAGRDKVSVGTKFHLRPQDTAASIIESVHGSLRRLDTDTIDVLLIHGAENPGDLDDPRVLAAYEKLRAEGAFRFRGLSCHLNHDAVIRKAVACGLYDMVQVGYNVFDIQETEKEAVSYPDYLGTSGIRGLLNLAAARDVGVIAMKTLKVGGRRQNLEKYRTGSTSLHQAMLKWVLEDGKVASAVTEILTWGQLEEDLAAAGLSLTVAESRTLSRYVRENGKDYCHMCGRCQKACPSGVASAEILRCLAYKENYGKAQRARESYARLPADRAASACRGCGTCEKVCPYGVAVRERIREALRALEASP